MALTLGFPVTENRSAPATAPPSESCVQRNWTVSAMIRSSRTPLTFRPEPRTVPVPMFVQPDGTDADSFAARGVTQHITRTVLERIQGQVTLASGRFRDHVFLTVVAYDVHGDNTKRALRELMKDTLAEFELVGTVD